MGVLDKIKNALFEVEYVEVEEPPKKEKKIKEKMIKDKKIKEEKPIAKKVVLPGKREEKIEELHEEELRDEDFEIRPKDEMIKAKEEFKFMDDKDFRVDDEEYYSEEEPQMIENVKPEEEPKIVEEVKREVPRETRVSREEKQQEVYNYYEKPAYSTPHESKPYGMDNSYNVPVHEYGTYEKKEEKTYFRPSPIISPIYGILDKNYKKEDVREKKEVRITSSYTRSNVSVDDIRNKAYGGRRSDREVEDVEEEGTTKFEVEEQDEDLLVDLSDRSKPEVKELTMGDAEEYFQDLGLEYNVDYVDVSTDRSTTPKKEEKPKHEAKEVITKLEEKSVEEEIEEKPIEEETPVEEIEEIIEDNSNVEKDDDNLFDLIDSMYEEN